MSFKEFRVQPRSRKACNQPDRDLTRQTGVSLKIASTQKNLTDSTGVLRKQIEKKLNLDQSGRNSVAGSLTSGESWRPHIDLSIRQLIQSEGRKREDVAIIVMIATDSRSIHVGTPKSSQRIMGRPQNDIVVPAIELHLMIPLDP